MSELMVVLAALAIMGWTLFGMMMFGYRDLVRISRDEHAEDRKYIAFLEDLAMESYLEK